MRASPLKLLILVVMSIVGLIASSIVLYLYYLLHQQLPGCHANQTFWGISLNCGAVLSSSYNSIYGFNLDVLAVAYFIVNLFLILLVAFGSDRLYGRAFKVLFAWRFVGLAIVPYLMTVEFIILKTVCIYCTIMHLSILVDFVIITYFIFYKKSLRTFLTSGSEAGRPLPDNLGPRLEQAFQTPPAWARGPSTRPLKSLPPACRSS
ncbi:MAG: vitamin K epoxide reductase family protein [Nitrososphaerales archaeon]|jgi:uncharacterized membrane protein